MTISSRKAILILQNEIMAYRKPVYNGLARDYDVTVIHSGPVSVLAEDRYHEIIVKKHSVGPFFVQPEMNLGAMFARFDCVVAMFDLRWPAYILPLSRAVKPKYILWGHRYSGNRIANFLRDRLMARADKLLMYGDEEVVQMVNRGIPLEKIVLAANTIHVPNYHDYSGAEKNSILFVGRLQVSKRVDDIIESFARLRDVISDRISLDIVGSGDIERDLRRLAKERGVSDRVVFHGRVDDHEVLAQRFASAYAYVSPSPVGLGVLHSFAYGVPVVTLQNARHGPEFHNISHGSNGLVCVDMCSFDRAVERICSSPSLTSDLGRRAYEFYSTKRTLELMLEGFRSAIEA
jgi:glycosyltransferase involved in cell wall biosynthesis